MIVCLLFYFYIFNEILANVEFDNYLIIRSMLVCDQLEMSNHSLRTQSTDLLFSHKSVVSIMHEQTIICRQLFAGHVVGS